MTTERCLHCGRTLEQSGQWVEIQKIFTGIKCVRCDDMPKLHINGKWCGNPEIAHAKAIRLAWHYRAITRRRCATCKEYDVSFCKLYAVEAAGNMSCIHYVSNAS